MDIQKALAEIRKKQFSPVYLILGTEEYLSDLMKKEIKAALLKSEDDEFNFASFDMEETPISMAVEEASTLPFFGDYRLVFIESPYFLTSEKKVGGPEHHVEELLEYVKQPLESSILVLFATYKKLDDRKKIVKQIKANAKVVEVFPMKEQALRQYVEQWITNEGYSITPDAYELLLRLTDMNLTTIIGELNKLFLYEIKSKRIKKNSVAELVPKSLEHNIFDLTEYVLQHKPSEAIELYHDLLLQGEETIKLNAILISQFRLLLQTKILMKQNFQQKNIADALKIHPFRVKLAMQQVQNFTETQLASAFDDLVENDYRMKTGQMDKNLLFELFVLKYAA